MAHRNKGKEEHEEKQSRKRSKIGKWYHDLKEDANGLFMETSAEIYVGVGIGILAGALITGHHEAERTKMIPLGFSEISQMEKDAQAAGDSLGPITRYLASANDAVMKVFESGNDANDRWNTLNNTRAFAMELETHTDPAFKFHHYSLENLLDQLPKLAADASNKLTNFTDVRNKIVVVNRYFDAAWDEDHQDNYHTEYDTDEDGNTTSHDVYDNTDHTYTYDKIAGESSSSHLDALIKSHPKFVLEEKIRWTTKTNAEGEYAADASRKFEGDKTRNTPQELLKIANTWNDCSTLKTNLSDVYSAWENLKESNILWKKAKNTAKSTSYRTCSSVDAGPKEFQVAEYAFKEGKVLDSKISEILDGIQYTSTASQTLKQKVHEYISVVMDNKPGNIRKLKGEIMNISKEIYSHNFKRGFDVNRFRGYVMILGVLFGGLAGGALGLATDKIGDRVWYRKRED